MYNGIIYKYTSPSNKYYIGQTINERARRSAFRNINHMYAGGKIDLARIKYGPENFTYEVLEIVNKQSKKELLNSLNTLEIFYIAKYDSYKNGYNSTKGGQIVYLYSDEARDKISKALSKQIIQYDLYGNYIKVQPSIKEASKELNIHKDAISRCCTGKAKRASIFIWRKYTEDFPLVIEGLPKDKIESILNSKESTNSKNGKTFKKVIQYTLQGDFIKVFESYTEAAKSVGLSSTTCISQCCKNKGASHGYIWRYYTENYPLKIEVDLSQHSLIVANKKNLKIYQYDLNRNLLNVWTSYKEITEALNIIRTGIYQCCTNKLKTYKNYIWSYVELD